MPSTNEQTASLRVVALESRRAAEMAKMIERTGGNAFVSPSMREVAVAEDRPAIDFANRLITAQIDAVIFLTGVGVTHFVDSVERHVPKQRLLDALSDVTTIVRGPKPLAVLREIGITPTIKVPEPNTWRELLATLDAELPLANLVVGVLEYGVPNVSLNAGLEARGATVESLSIYRWDLPEDIEPLKQNVRRIAAGDADLILFTSAQQVVHLLKVAGQMKQEDAVRSGLRNAVVASIGPTTSEMLRSQGLPVDFEPSHGKMGHLVTESLAAAESLLKRKLSVTARLSAAVDKPDNSPWGRYTVHARVPGFADAPTHPFGSCDKQGATWPSIARYAARFRSWNCARTHNFVAR